MLLGNYGFEEAVLHFVVLNYQTVDNTENLEQLKVKTEKVRNPTF